MAFVTLPLLIESLRPTSSFNSFEKPCGGKHRSNMSGDYSIMNLQGLRSNPCLGFISRKTLVGKK